VWIETTASMEGRGDPNGHIPPLIRRTIGKLLFGDIDIKSLFSRQSSIPNNITAIRSSYYKYKFGKPGVTKDWWVRTLYAHSGRIWTKDSFKEGFEGLDIVTADSGKGIYPIYPVELLDLIYLLLL